MSNVIDLITRQPYQTGLEIIQDLGGGLFSNMAHTVGAHLGYRQDIAMTHHAAKPTYYDCADDAFADVRECLIAAERDLRKALLEINNMKAMMERFNEIR